MVNEVLTASAGQAGKQALVNILEQRHASRADLNAVWHTSYGSWNDLLATTNKLEADAAGHTQPVQPWLALSHRQSDCHLRLRPALRRGELQQMCLARITFQSL